MNETSERGWSPLASAVWERLDEMQAVLVAAGADLSAARAAVQEAKLECQRKRDVTPPPPSTLASVIKNDRIDLLKKFVAAGADVNAELYQGTSLLMYAAQEGRADAARTLMEAGANPHRMSNYGETALKNAALQGSTSVIQTLLDAGVSICSPDAAVARRWAEHAGRAGVAACLSQ